MKKPQCVRCGRALSDPFSIAVGMGPDCRGDLAKKGWKFPKPKWNVIRGHVVLVGMDGKVEPPPVNISDRKKKAKKVKDETEDESH